MKDVTITKKIPLIFCPITKELVGKILVSTVSVNNIQATPKMKNMVDILRAEFFMTLPYCIISVSKKTNQEASLLHLLTLFLPGSWQRRSGVSYRHKLVNIVNYGIVTIKQ